MHQVHLGYIASEPTYFDLLTSAHRKQEEKITFWRYPHKTGLANIPVSFADRLKFTWHS